MSEKPVSIYMLKRLKSSCRKVGLCPHPLTRRKGPKWLLDFSWLYLRIPLDAHASGARTQPSKSCLRPCTTTLMVTFYFQCATFWTAPPKDGWLIVTHTAVRGTCAMEPWVSPVWLQVLSPFCWLWTWIFDSTATILLKCGVSPTGIFFFVPGKKKLTGSVL